jgi:glycosyltransferase involved in cell wall biosynthesis
VLDGLHCQKKKPDEIIIADDGSGRDTAEVIKSFSKTVSYPVLHTWQEDKGFRAARIRNKALKKSTADYIILLDGDCVINRYFISDHLLLSAQNTFVQGKRILVSRDASATFTHVNANSLPDLIKMASKGKISNIHHLIRIPFALTYKDKKLKGIKSCNMSFFRKNIMAVNGFNEDFEGWGNEDSELAQRFFKYGIMKKNNPFSAICFHLWHPLNKNIADNNKHILSATNVSNEYFCKNGIFKKN